MREMTALQFNLGKYLRDTESENSKALLQNFEAIKLFLQAFENSDNTCVNTNNNYKYFVVDDINKIDCEKKEYKKAKDYNNEMYVGIENEKFALVTLNAKYIKKNLSDIETGVYLIENDNGEKENYKFYTGFDKKLRDKLNVLLNKTENKSFNEFYFDIVNVCLNSEEIMYLMFEDKNNKENNFVLFKFYFTRKYYGTSNKTITFCDAFVLFFNRLGENRREYNFLVFKNVICEKDKIEYINEELKNVNTIKFYKLKKFYDFGFDYFKIMANLKNGTHVFSYDNIGEFDVCGVENLKLLQIMKMENGLIIEKGIGILGLFEKEKGSYEKIYIERASRSDAKYYVKTEYGYFDYTSEDFWSENCVIGFYKQNKHRLLGPAKVLFMCNRHGEIEYVGDGRSNCCFYIDDNYCKLEEYIESLRNLVSEKHLTKFLVKYTL